MRVQHNITAMNSYRNYNNNTSTINKNIEKLSSGYKINRAGDNAAGLAISEKMRAQITGLDVAQKNAKDGISLVQTAEGALTEVHSMLNRMAELAEQSANGTYDSSLDRDQLQKEVNQLRTEINRIADSTNFNGIKLLNGSMSAEGATITSSSGVVDGGTVTAAAKEVSTLTAPTMTIAAGDKVTVNLTYYDDSNSRQTQTFEFLADSSGNLIYTNGAKDDYNTSETTVTGALEKVIKNQDEGEKLNNIFTVSGTTYTAQEAGAGKGQIVGFNVSLNGVEKAGSVVTRTTAGIDEATTYTQGKLTSLAIYTGASSEKAANAVFQVNGYKFALATAGNGSAFDSDVNVVYNTGWNAAATKDLVQTINRVTGRELASVNASDNTSIDFKSNTGDALKLQIGDTGDSFNQLKVSIGDVHAQALGISGIDISNQESATNAMDAIKAAINTVSDVRGTLGATQNRLEHTINNLSVMQENIQDAESTIRDTDVADEMMKYTKNSILVQSAQAMLAQANQQPQGVLQLLQ